MSPERQALIEVFGLLVVGTALFGALHEIATGIS